MKEGVMDDLKVCVFVEYGTYASDKRLRMDLGVLDDFSSQDIVNANRLLTRTMLSVIAFQGSMYQMMADKQYVLPIDGEGYGGEAAWALIRRLANDEDRSITWPGYPDPSTRRKWPDRPIETKGAFAIG